MVHTQPHRRDSPRFRSTLRGWRLQQHLILDRPRDNNGAYAVLEERSPCVIRYLRDGKACAFESQILSWEKHRSSPYLRIRWPHDLTFSTFRKHERVPLKLACTVVRQDGLKTTEELWDLSAAGCRLFS
ncbi:MAG: flagellar brake protein, partial [Candidatus Hydrogenedentes bacterium]|nr:flagellar brake protein [Candidatus Hydrogenedentota bacterium]